jgi:hypothetical protein
VTPLVNTLFYASPWPGVLLWAALYVSDFLFTMTCARLYQTGAKAHMSFGGSYEITPYFQDDVDKLRLVSPRFFSALAASSLLLYLVWWTSQPIARREIYSFTLGAMVLLQLIIHVRHLRNFYMFRAALGTGRIRGHIEYDRSIVLRLSSVELVASSAVFLVAFLITSSWFVLGGAMTCALVGVKHLTLARQDTVVSPGSA